MIEALQITLIICLPIFFLLHFYDWAYSKGKGEGEHNAYMATQNRRSLEYEEATRKIVELEAVRVSYKERIDKLYKLLNIANAALEQILRVEFDDMAKCKEIAEKALEDIKDGDN